MATNLPIFKYHPDPIRTGSVVAEDSVCECCGKKVNYIYIGPILSEQDVDRVCPWCIADGAAHKKFDAEFTDIGSIGSPSSNISGMSHYSVRLT